MEELGTRERLLEVGTELFAARGFAEVSVRDLAGGAGANVATVSYYFGSKEGLYREVVRREVEDLGRVAQDLESEDDAGTVLRNFSQGVAALHRRHPFLASLVHREILHPSPVFLEEVAPKLTHLARKLRQQVERGRDAGLWRRDVSVPLAAYGLVAMLNYFFLFSPLITLILPDLVPMAEQERGAFTEQIWEIWVRGVGGGHGE